MKRVVDGRRWSKRVRRRWRQRGPDEVRRAGRLPGVSAQFGAGPRGIARGSHWRSGCASALGRQHRARSHGALAQAPQPSRLDERRAVRGLSRAPDSVHKAELNTLYQRRWGIELDFGCLKTALGMDVPARLQPDPPADGPGRRAQRTGAAAAELQTYRAAVERVELARPLPRCSGRCHAAVRSHRPGACRKSTRTKRATSAKATPQVLPMAEGSSTRGTTTQSESSNVASRQVSAIGSRRPPASRSASASRGPACAPPAGARIRRRATGA